MHFIESIKNYFLKWKYLSTRKLLALFVFVLFSVNVNALYFNSVGGTFSMHGTIEKDDFVKFVISLATWESPPTIFHIDSEGGNLDQAMMIGEIIRASQIPVWSGEKCYSACVFIYVSGVERIARGSIGLHRPYFERAYFSELTSLEAKEKYDELKQESVVYLKKMEVAQSLIDRIFETGSTDVDIIQGSEADKLFGTRSPFYDEWLTAKCGKYTEEQSTVLDSWGNLKAVRSTLSVLNDESIPRTDDFGSNLNELIEGAWLALEMEKSGALAPYIELFKTNQKCGKKAVSRHVFSFHRDIQKYVLDLGNGS
jgi:hypothetical protein